MDPIGPNSFMHKRKAQPQVSLFSQLPPPHSYSLCFSTCKFIFQFFLLLLLFFTGYAWRPHSSSFSLISLRVFVLLSLLLSLWFFVRILVLINLARPLSNRRGTELFFLDLGNLVNNRFCPIFPVLYRFDCFLSGFLAKRLQGSSEPIGRPVHSPTGPTCRSGPILTTLVPSTHAISRERS